MKQQLGMFTNGKRVWARRVEDTEYWIDFNPANGYLCVGLEDLSYTLLRAKGKGRPERLFRSAFQDLCEKACEAIVQGTPRHPTVSSTALIAEDEGEGRKPQGS